LIEQRRDPLVRVTKMRHGPAGNQDSLNGTEGLPGLVLYNYRSLPKVLRARR